MEDTEYPMERNGSDENYFRRKFLLTFMDVDLFLKKSSIDKFCSIMWHYMTGLYNNSNTGCVELQYFVGAYIKHEFDYIPSIGLITAMDKVIESMFENGHKIQNGFPGKK